MDVSRSGFEQELDSHRRDISSSSFRSIAQLMIKNAGSAKKKGENEPIHAALGKDLDETIPTMSDRTLTRNRALLHYIATLAVSNSEQDEFNYEFVQSLLDGGADINKAVDVHGQTIFHEVARSWNLDVAAFLLKNGANIDQQDKFGRSPLHVCAAADHADMVEFLLQRGANIDSLSSGDGQTPLHFAAKNDATLSLKALLGFGANIDSLDSRGRSPLQVAAELSRAAAARILIEEGASSCIYDSNGSSALTVLTEKIPNLAIQALDQLHVSDTITRRELYYLNLLEESRLKKKTKKARTPLETAVYARQYDVLMHPVMQRLVAIKWDQYGRLGTILDLMMNLVYAVMFTVFAVETPGVGKELYLPLSAKAWRLILGLILILINTYMIYIQVRTTINAQKNQKSWIKWRLQQLKDDLQYCHPRWREEKYVKDEMRLIKGLPSLSTIDSWFVFDWFIVIVVLVAVGLNLGYFLDGSNSVKRAYINVLSILVILVWFRILKYLRPFPGIGTLVLILGAIVGDFVTWGFFYILLFVPFTASFWIIFGGNSLNEVPSYSRTQRLIYTMIQMSVGEDFDLEGLVSADPVMARLLSSLYLTFMVIVCLNILIAYLSNTFTSVYSKAVENTNMQRAINVLTIEKFLTKKRREKYFRYVREHASPAAVSLVTISETRQAEKDAEQLQKDFKKSHNILTQRFRRPVGKGKPGTFDALLGDVEKLKRLQNNTVNDLKTIQSGLEELSNIMFGASSPLKNHFEVTLSSNFTFQPRTLQRVGIDTQRQSPSLTRRSGSEANGTIHSSQSHFEDSEKKSSLSDLIPKVSTFKEKEKVDKREKKSVQFANDDNKNEEEWEERNEDLLESRDEQQVRSNIQSKTRERKPKKPSRVSFSSDYYENRRRSLTPGRDQQSTEHTGRQSLDLVPYTEGFNNVGFDDEDPAEKWEKISLDSISL